jgi:hypothetical protein
MDRFDEIRLARRQVAEGKEHKECAFASSSLDEVVASLEMAFRKEEGVFTVEGLKARLHIIGPELAEGFFADAVLLVEGSSDRAALIAAAQLSGIDLQALGIAVVQADGKTKLDRPAAIFQKLGIPTYLVWDCDRQTDRICGEETNKALQRLCGVSEEMIVGAATKVEPQFACFERDVESTLKEELGADRLNLHLDATKVRYGMEHRNDVLKAPFAMMDVLRGAAAEGQKSATLQNIVDAVLRLSGRSSAQKPASGCAPLEVA